MSTTKKITTEKRGRRSYFAGPTYHVRDMIKDMGGHWDASSKKWWVGKDELAAKILTAANTKLSTMEIPAYDPDFQPQPKRRHTDPYRCSECSGAKSPMYDMCYACYAERRLEEQWGPDPESHVAFWVSQKVK